VVAGDEELLARLRAGQEQAFVELVGRYHSSMVRLASSFVPSWAVAEEVAQDAWVAVLRGVERFEGRSSLKTWLFSIVLNRARSAGTRERRAVPIGDPGPVLDPRCFNTDGAWSQPPVPWPEEVEERLSAQALARDIRAMVDSLPEGPRRVVLLRDVEGIPSGEVCELLGISEGNQRVLLHRGRARVRELIGRRLGGVAA
jgi:RNA polymerase sigma-70 factor (ECF subfamily)